MNILPDIGFPRTGETAEAGTYACMNCQHETQDDEAVKILYKRETLPECPVCGFTYWMKI